MVRVLTLASLASLSTNPAVSFPCLTAWGAWKRMYARTISGVHFLKTILISCGDPVLTVRKQLLQFASSLSPNNVSDEICKVFLRAV